MWEITKTLHTANPCPSGAYWIAARVFGSLLVILAFCGISLISIATWTKLKRQTWLIICALFLVITLSQGLQMLFLKRNLCNVWLFPGTKAMITSQCKLSTDGAIGVAAMVLWLIIAAGCCHIARRSKWVQWYNSFCTLVVLAGRTDFSWCCLTCVSNRIEK